MLNKIIIHGRCVADPELRTTQSGVAVATVTVAVDRDFTSDSGNRETDFIPVVAWRQSANFLSQYFRKGQLIIVEGRLTSRKWTDKDGNKRTSWEIVADHTYFGEPKRESSGDSYGGYRPSQGAVNAPPPEDDGFKDLGSGYGDGNPFREQTKQQSFADLPDDDGELPFD